MAEVLEATRVTADAVLDELDDLGASTSMVHSGTTSDVHPLVGFLNSERARTVPTRALVGAVGTWFALIYALCYVVLPTAGAALGLYSNLVPNLIVNTIALAPAALITMALVAASQPTVVTNLRASRDPVIAATAGSLLAWLGLVETVDVVQPLSGMPWYEALTFLGFNIVEQGMLGMMLASFTRSPAKAFALGAAFQVLVLGLFVGIVS